MFMATNLKEIQPKDGGENMSHKVEFLFRSIEDTQGAIRAVDTKLGFVFVVLAIPLTNLGGIFKSCLSLFGTSSSWLILFILFGASWISAFYVFFMAASAISNPANAVGGRSGLSGIFYGGDIYRLNWLSAFRNMGVLSTQDHSFQVSRLPGDEKAVIDELVFEKMKLCYIREIKMMRLHWCINATLLWVAFGGVIWFFSLVLK